MNGGAPQWLDGESSRRKVIDVFVELSDQSCPEPVGFSPSLLGLSLSPVPLDLDFRCLGAELRFVRTKCSGKCTHRIEMLLGGEHACGGARVGVGRAPIQRLVEPAFLITRQPGKRYQPCAQTVVAGNQIRHVIGQDGCRYRCQEWIHASRCNVFIH